MSGCGGSAVFLTEGSKGGWRWGGGADRLRAVVGGAAGARWCGALAEAAAAAWSRGHGRLPQWRAALEDLPRLPVGEVRLDADWVSAGHARDCDPCARRRLEAALMALHPWRKGPFRLYGLAIDAEWRSDRKWARLAPHIQPLAGRRVLDVGCGNGYYCLRMAGAGAAGVLGIDPTLLYVVQHQALRRYFPPLPVEVLPLSLEALPPGEAAFDTVFSMGVLYHRRSPLDHLAGLRALLRPGGELVLETLVIEGDARQALLPEGRYAKMRNVWFIPSPAALLGWLRRCGFRDARVVDVSITTPQEQRATAWMRFESLADFLDPADASRTVEGLPAPRRAILLARR